MSDNEHVIGSCSTRRESQHVWQMFAVMYSTANICFKSIVQSHILTKINMEIYVMVIFDLHNPYDRAGQLLLCYA